MGEEEKSGQWVEAGVKISLMIIPDHQLESFRSISQDSLKLFRISLVVFSIYATIFGLLLNAGGEITYAIVQDPLVLIGIITFLLSLGGSIAVYRICQHYWVNSMSSTEYLDLAEDMPSSRDRGLNADKMTYEYYWRNCAKYSSTLKKMHTTAYLSIFFLYNAVVFLSVAIIRVFVELPGWSLVGAIVVPFLTPLLIAKLVGWFWKVDSPVFVPEEELQIEE
jgi:uncharacterized protein with PQ loop repeat